MAALTIQKLVNAGTAPTFAPLATADTVEYGNGRNTFLVVRETASAAASVTVDPAGNTEYGKPLPSNEITLAADGEVWIPLVREYDDGSGLARVIVSVSGAVSAAAVRVG